MLSTKHKIKLAGYIYILIKIYYKIFKKKIDIYNLDISRNNINWSLDLSEGIDLSIFIFGNSEKKLSRLKNLLPSKKKYFFIDVGSNIGSASLFLAKNFKDSKIISIEPTFYAYNKFLKNLELNPVLKKQIVPVNNLVSSKQINREIYSSWKVTKSNSDKTHNLHLGIAKEYNNSYIRLDDLLTNYKFNSIDFIKIDVDGNELFVLQSAMECLKKFKPIIFIELAPYLYKENGYSFDEIFNLLNIFEYEFYSDDLKKINKISDYVKSIKKGSSKNIYLI